MGFPCDNECAWESWLVKSRNLKSEKLRPDTPQQSCKVVPSSTSYNYPWYQYTVLILQLKSHIDLSVRRFWIHTQQYWYVLPIMHAISHSEVVKLPAGLDLLFTPSACLDSGWSYVCDTANLHWKWPQVAILAIEHIVMYNYMMHCQFLPNYPHCQGYSHPDASST